MSRPLQREVKVSQSFKELYLKTCAIRNVAYLPFDDIMDILSLAQAKVKWQEAENELVRETTSKIDISRITFERVVSELNQMAAWDCGDEVNDSFDNPQMALKARALVRMLTTVKK